MRPYLAVIRDSFREAFATRVLWIVLILIVVSLMAIAPFGYQKSVPTTIQFFDLRDPKGLLQELASGAENPELPAGRIYSRFPERLQDELKQASTSSGDRERFRTLRPVLDRVNEILKHPDFYNEAAWADLTPGIEARELLKIETDDRTPQQINRLNRLAFDTAFRKFVEPAGRDALQFAWFGSPILSELPLTEDQFVGLINELLTLSLTLVVGYVGMFIALLVTASMVPQMLEPGSLDLLLSKPVSRSLLLLTRFAGGCVFILLNASLLMVGLWLIFGFRFNIWNDGLLWSIPVFVFVFAVFYSVSTLAAILWRNAIVSIVVSIAFWAVCFGVGLTKSVLDANVIDARRTAAIISIGDSLLVTTFQGSGAEWNAEAGRWRPLFQERRRGNPFGPPQYPFVGPVLDSSAERLVAIRQGGGRGFFRGSAKLVTTSAEQNWRFSDQVDVPAGTSSLMLSSEGDILTAGAEGLFRLTGELSNEEAISFFGFKIPGLSEDASFQRIDDRTLEWSRPVSAALDRATQRVVVVTGQTLAVLSMTPEGRYVTEHSVERTSSHVALAGIAGRFVIVAEDDGTLLIYRTDGLELLHEYQPFGANQPRSIDISPDGKRIAVLFHHRWLWLFDTELETGESPALIGQGDISTVAFDESGRFLVADRFGRVIRYSGEKALSEEARFEPELELVEWVYATIIQPVHTVFPKPDEMTNLTRWLMTGQESKPSADGELTSNRKVVDVWQPLWSNLAFLVFVLTLNCVLISRRDF
jgi:hypothetical protein